MNYAGTHHLNLARFRGRSVRNHFFISASARFSKSRLFGHRLDRSRANSRLHFWQLFLPSLSVLGRDNCSSANFASHEAACFDLATNRGQTDVVLTRELTKRIRPLHLHCFQAAHGTILRFNESNHPQAHRRTSVTASGVADGFVTAGAVIAALGYEGPVGHRWQKA